MANHPEIIRQHFLPQCYLEGFMNKANILYALNLGLFVERGKIPYARESNPDKICKEEHFYTIDDKAKAYNLNGVTDKYLVEKSFHSYENTYKGLVAKIASGEPLSYADASELVRIIIDLKIRNKFYREKIVAPLQHSTIAEAFEEVGKMMAEDYHYSEAFSGLSSAQMLSINEAIRQKFSDDTGFMKNAHISALARPGDAYAELQGWLISKFLSCRWVVQRSDQRFISNDNPGWSLGWDNKPHPTFLTENFMFVFPLNSSLILSISDSGVDEAFLKDNRQKVYLTMDANEDLIRVSHTFALYFFNKIAFGPDSAALDLLAQQYLKKPDQAKTGE